jgi:hypothetical protein
VLFKVSTGTLPPQGRRGEVMFPKDHRSAAIGAIKVSTGTLPPQGRRGEVMFPKDHHSAAVGAI